MAATDLAVEEPEREFVTEAAHVIKEQVRVAKALVHVIKEQVRVIRDQVHAVRAVVAATTAADIQAVAEAEEASAVAVVEAEEASVADTLEEVIPAVVAVVTDDYSIKIKQL